MNMTNTRSLNRGGHHPAAIRGLAIAAFASAAFALSAAAETIAYWPFGTNGFHDVSGNGHDLVGVEIAESDDGYIVFNGTNSYLKTAAALDLSGEQQVTFECWARALPMKSSVGIILSSEAPMTAGGFVLYNNTQDPKYIHSQFRMTANDWQYGSDTLRWFNDDGWHHIAFTVDRTKTTLGAVQFYLDGSPEGTAGASGTVPAFFNGLLLIGGGCASYIAGDNFFAGYIDDVRVSRGILTKDEFMKYPSVGKTMRADSSELPVVAYWPFGGKRGKDTTGNGFDLVMSNILFQSGTPYTSFSTRKEEFACSPNQTIPFSAFSKTGLTIEMFVKAESASPYMAMILESSQSYWSSRGSFRISYDANPDGYRTISAMFHIKGDTGAGSATAVESFGNLGDNKWRHIAIVYDPSKTGSGIVTLYVDGVPGTCSAPNVNQGAFALGDLPLYFFRRANSQIGDESAALPFYGALDDVRITGCALTPDQFLPARSTGSTVALYRFDRETIEDQSGNGNDLVHMQTEDNVAAPIFGDAGYPDSGTGLVFTGPDGTKEWVKTSAPVDFSESKMLTVEFDYNNENPSSSSHGVYVMAASENTKARGGFVVYRNNNSLQGQLCKNDGSRWLNNPYKTLGTYLNGYWRGRYSVNAKSTTDLYVNLTVDGAVKSVHNSGNYGSLGSHVLCFGHCPSYGGDYNGDTPRYLKGKLLRVAVSDIALDPADYVLDNLVLDTPKTTLAYWNFRGDAGLSVDGVPRRGGALDLGGSSSATTTNLTLSALTQATIECFVCFGETPSSGTLFSMGTGAGSFAVAADATAGTLSGSFIPYDHLAASNGGITALAPLAGKKVWHHVALVVDRTNPGADAVRFYVDYERTMPAGRAWDAAARLLDESPIVVGNGFTGRIDDLRVSAGALAPSEFLQLDERTEVIDGMILILR